MTTAKGETLGQRVLELRKELGKSQKEMSAVLGVATATWQKVERDEGLPSGDTLMQFEKLGINPGWVLSGLGPKKLVGDDDQPTLVGPVTARQLIDAVNRITQYAANLQPGQLVEPAEDRERSPVTGTGKVLPFPSRSTIKYLPQLASAGGGAVVLEESEIDFDAEDISRELLGILPTDLLMLKIKGDSMEPTFSERDIVIVDRSLPRPRDKPIDGRIYLVSIDGELYVKRARYLLGGVFHWASDNDVYDPIIVEGERMNLERIVGEVIWAWRKM